MIRRYLVPTVVCNSTRPVGPVVPLFAATAPPIPTPEAPFGWQLPTIHPMLAPAPHLASPRSPETARLEFLSTQRTRTTISVGRAGDHLAVKRELTTVLEGPPHSTSALETPVVEITAQVGSMRRTFARGTLEEAILVQVALPQPTIASPTKICAQVEDQL